MKYWLIIKYLQNISIVIEILAEIPVVIISCVIFVVIQIQSQLLHLFLKEIIKYPDILLLYSPLVNAATNTDSAEKKHAAIFAFGFCI